MIGVSSYQIELYLRRSLIIDDVLYVLGVNIIFIRVGLLGLGFIIPFSGNKLNNYLGSNLVRRKLFEMVLL